MNEQDIDLDQSFETEELETPTEETTPEPAAPQYATREEIAELKALLLAGQQPAQRQSAPEPEYEELDPYAQNIVSQVGGTLAPLFNALQSELAELRADRAISDLGIDKATVDQLTEGFTPSEKKYYMTTPAFKNAAKLAAASKRESVRAPRAANANGGSVDPFANLSAMLKRDVEF
jgi:hypothetical protein